MSSKIQVVTVVQSVAVRLIVEREHEIQQFKGEDSFRVTAIFHTTDGAEFRGELNRRFSTKEEAQNFLEQCIDKKFTIREVTTKPMKRVPAPPFTTSTLQQEAAHKLGFTVAQTMMMAQHLYENGHITYMRTDSVNLSTLCLGASKNVITEQMGEEYVKTRQYHTQSKGAQEAHEAIRPTDMSATQIEGAPQERRLYDLIWKRTIACQMADAEIEKTSALIDIEGLEDKFTANGEVVKFDGFLRVYRETQQEEENAEEGNTLLPPLKEGQPLVQNEIIATQRFAQRPVRYNEASLVRKLEELGIGRPSTYATTITTVQQREYVQKGEIAGEEKSYIILTEKDGQITSSEQKLLLGAERGKLIPTDMGVVVNDFLLESFPEILDYNFTAEVEKQFDDIAEGNAQWNNVIADFYKEFEPLVEKAVTTRTEHKVGERCLGQDPESGESVFVKIGRFGPVAQLGSADSPKKPRFAQLKKEQSMETITLEEALELFRLPRKMGEYEGKTVIIGAGRFGPYVAHGDNYISIPKNMDPLKMTFEESVILLHKKYMEERERHLKAFDEDPELEVLNGRYGPYLVYKGANYRLPKAMHERAANLSYEECMGVIKSQEEKPAVVKRHYERNKT